MQRLLLAVLVAGAGYFAWSEYGSGPRLSGFSASSGGSGGMGLSKISKAPGTVASGAMSAVGN